MSVSWLYNKFRDRGDHLENWRLDARQEQRIIKIDFCYFYWTNLRDNVEVCVTLEKMHIIDCTYNNRNLSCERPCSHYYSNAPGNNDRNLLSICPFTPTRQRSRPKITFLIPTYYMHVACLNFVWWISTTCLVVCMLTYLCSNKISMTTNPCDYVYMLVEWYEVDGITFIYVFFVFGKL